MADQRPGLIGRIRGVLGARAEATAAPTVQVSRAVDEHQSFSSALDDELVPELRWPESLEVYDAMRRQDAQIISMIRAVTLPIRRTTWRIDPAGASDDVVEFVAANLGLPIVGQDPEPQPRTRDRFSWSEHLHLALTSLVFGHSYFEQTYRIAPDAFGVQRAWIRKLAWIPPKTISKIDVASDGGLVSLEQGRIASLGKVEPLEVGRLVAYVNDREGGNWLGQSMLRGAYKHWKIKDGLIRIQVQTIERNGMGVPVVEAPKIPDNIFSATEWQALMERLIADGLAIAKGFRAGRSAGASVANGASVKLLGVEGTLPDAEAPIRYHDEQIARAFLGHFLNLGTETGSWALGSTFADFFTLSLQTVAKSIADVASQHIVEDLVDWNFGPEVPAPRVVFDEIGSQQRITAESLKILVDAKILRPDETLDQFARQLYNLPAAKSAAEGSERVVDIETARAQAEVVQKVYLGVDKVLTAAEARTLLRAAGLAVEGDMPTATAPAAEPTATEEP